jgi:riboflavin kinase/FMN adenylyltransferase
MLKIFRSIDEAAANPQPSVVTIGNFDGVHRGHEMVLHAVKSRAMALGARSIAVTFEPHPLRVLRPEVDIRLITPLREKTQLLLGTGIDDVLVLPFTPEFARWSAHDFAERVLRDALQAVEVHEGENFRFGSGATTDVTGLTELGNELGFGVRSYEPYLFDGEAVSSGRIRTLITAGDVESAAKLLGRPFSILSTPAAGRGYGTRYTVPTINLAPYTEMVPANGVYVTTLRVGEGESAHTFRSITNAGNRPTFGADSFAIESHLFDFEPLELTEQTPLELTFLHRLRGEIRFPSPEALRTQITTDIEHAHRYFALSDKLATGNS